MTDQSAQLADAASDIDEAANAGLVPQLSMMIGALFASPVRNTLLILGSGLVVVDSPDCLRANPAQQLEPALL